MMTVGNFEYNQRDLLGHGAFALVFKGRRKKVNPKLPYCCSAVSGRHSLASVFRLLHSAMWLLLGKGLALPVLLM